MLNDAELQTLNGVFAKPTLDESLDIASRGNPDIAAESNLTPIDARLYEKNKPEIERKKLISGINTPSLQKTNPKTSQWLSNPKNSTVAIDDLDILKGMEDSLNKKGFWGSRYDDLRRGFANLKRTGVYIGAESHMDSVTHMSLVDEMGITERGQIESALNERGLSAGTDPRVQEYITASPERRKELKDQITGQLVKRIGSVAKFTKESADIPKDEAGQKFAQTETFAEAWGAFTDAPIDVAAGITTESLAQFAPAIPFMFAGSPAIAAIGAGGTSLSNEYVGDIMGSMQEAGIDVENETALLTAMSDPVKLAAWQKHAVKRGLPIAIVDAISAGIGGRVVNMAKTFTGKAIAGGVEALGIQPVLGGLGEIAGAVSAGDEISGKDVLAEMLGELGPGMIETAGGVYTNSLEAKSQKSVVQAIETFSEQNTIDEVVSFAQSSNTNKRAAEQYKDFVKSLGDRNVLVPSDVVLDMENAPGYIIEQVNDLGVDISIPMDKFASDIAANPEWMALLRPHIKLSETTLTQAELEEGDRGEIQTLLEKAQAEKETITESDRIFNDVKEQIKSTGMQSDQTARHSAAIYPAAAAVYVERAKKLGQEMSPQEVYEMMGFKMEKGQPSEAAILNQPKIPEDLDIQMELETIETGEIVEESFNAKELHDDINDRMENYKRLMDCLG